MAGNRNILPADYRLAVFRAKSPYDFGLLGICTDVASFRAALEYDDGNGKKGDKEAEPNRYMDIAGSRFSHRSLWRLCFWKT